MFLRDRAPADPARLDRVRPEDLNVAPALLGAPLARPGRRLAAVTVDVVAVGLLSNLGNVWLVVGLVLVAVVHLREPGAADSPRRRWVLGALAAALIAFGAQQAWVQGVHPREARTAPDDDSPPAAVPGLTPLQTAQARIVVLEAELALARRPRPFDLQDRVDTWAEEVGLGLGWAIAYFSLLPVWWKGQTIGKRLFGLRVVELTGKPLTFARTFKRYGGYAAGIATGFVGFLQVLWDPNRQAIQDKAAHTVVIDLRRKLADPLPTPPKEPA